MSIDQPIARVVSLLEDSGYRTLGEQISVGGIPFEFRAVLAGETSLDLVAVVDTVTDGEDRFRGRVEGLSRALDLAGSRRSLTVILVGPPPVLSLTHALARVCRVLVTGTPTGPNADDELRDALAVLMPLKLSTDRDGPAESWVTVRNALLATYADADTAAVFEASELGADAVRQVLRQMLVAPLGEEEP